MTACPTMHAWVCNDGSIVAWQRHSQLVYVCSHRQQRNIPCIYIHTALTPNTVPPLTSAGYLHERGATCAGVHGHARVAMMHHACMLHALHAWMEATCSVGSDPLKTEIDFLTMPSPCDEAHRNAGGGGGGGRRALATGITAASKARQRAGAIFVLENA